MNEPLVDDGHRVARLLEKEDRVADLDLVRRPDRLLHKREIPADEPAGSAARLRPASHVATDASRRPGGRKRREQRRHCRIAHARDQIIDGGTMENAQVRTTHEPEVQRGDIRVADEWLWVTLEDLGLEVGNHAHSAISPSAADDRFDAGIQPYPHEVLGATFVFGARETTQRRDLRIEENGISGTLERFHTAGQPANAR